MREDTLWMRDRTGWSGSRRRLLGAAAGLWLPALLPEDKSAANMQETSSAGLRDFAYVCTALVLDAQERDDLKALAGMRRETSSLYLTPEALVAAGYTQERAQRIFADGARQLYGHWAANKDASQVLELVLAEGTASDGAADILQVFQSGWWGRDGSGLATPVSVPDADGAFLGTARGILKGTDPPREYNWRFGGVRFGSIVAHWQVGFLNETPDVALAAPINRILRNYLTDRGAPYRRGASLGFLLTIPEQPSIDIVQTVLDGTVLGSRMKDEALIAEQQAFIERVGGMNGLLGEFAGPGSLKIVNTIAEFRTVGHASRYYASIPELVAKDKPQGATSRRLASGELSLSGWDDWRADADQIPAPDGVLQKVRVTAITGSFVIAASVGDKMPPDMGTAVPATGDATLRQWSAIAQQLLASVPNTARTVPDLAARAVFPPPVSAFPDPLAG